MVPPFCTRRFTLYNTDIYKWSLSRASTGVFIIRLHICMYKLQSLYTSRDYAARLIPSGWRKVSYLSLVLNLLINHHRCRCRRRICSPRFLRLSTIQRSTVRPETRGIHDRSFTYTVSALDGRISRAEVIRGRVHRAIVIRTRILSLHENCEITNARFYHAH